MKRIFALLLCGILLLEGCAGGEKPSVSADLPSETLPSGTVALITEDTTLPPPSETLPSGEITVPSLSETDPLEFEIDAGEYSELIELETGFLVSNAAAGTSESGHSGSGYVENLSGGGSVLVEPAITSPQHYDITVRAASDAEVSGSLYVSGSLWGRFTLAGTGDYEAVMFTNVYLTPGAQLMLADFSGEARLDCVLVENSEDIYSVELTPSAELITPDPDPSAVKLYEYLLSESGRHVLSGQQVEEGSDRLLDDVMAATGRYPAIRFGDLMGYSAGEDTGDAELAIEWAERGGIVGYTWYWTLNGSCYQARTSFDLENAVTETDVATMDADTVAMRAQNGEIPLETLALIAGIDAVAPQLKKLKDAGAAVLFRLLPEAASGQFWWSRSAESYLWLYELIFDRMTLYHGLNNLIWVWNGQDAAFYPGDELCDIVSLDLYYPDGSPEAGRSGVNSFISAAGVTKNKLMAISECSVLPRPDEMSRDGCFWSFAAAWSGEYAADALDRARFYNSTAVITLDELEYNR